MSVVTPSDQPRPLEGHRPLWLDDPATAWVLAEGRAQVFAVELVDGRPTGPRRPLFAVSAGGSLLPAPPGGPLALVAVGIEHGTQARPVALAELRAARELDAAESADLVEGWLEALAGAVDALAPREVVPLEPGRPASVPAGTHVQAESRMAWIPGGAALEPFGDALGDVGDDLVLPLPGPAWAVARTALDTTPVAGADALREPAAWAGVAALERTLLQRLARGLAERDAGT